MSDDMTILICGGRHYTNVSAVREVVEKLKPRCIISGGATGADTLANREASRLGCLSMVFRADWKKHGKAAGPIRNRQMLEEGRPDLVVAFPGGRGTQDMIRQAEKAGVKVLKISAHPSP